MKKNLNDDVLIYILNHNYSKYLKRSIDSVINQSYKNFKLLIIDDGSTDNSRKILKSYSNFENIKVIYQKKIGMIRSIIKAVKITKSKFFVRLDADDWLHKDYLKKTIKTINSNKKIALVFPDYFEVNSSGKIINKIKRNKFGEKNTLLDFPAHGACTLFRRSLYNKTEGYSSKIEAQDGYDIWLKIIKNYQVKNINQPLFYYRQHNENLTKNLKKILDNRYRILNNQSENSNSRRTLAFIPILENDKKKIFCFQKFNRKKLIDITLNKAIRSKKIKKICLSSNNPKILDYVKLKYKNLRIKVDLHLRSKKNDYILDHALKNYLNKNHDKNIENIAILTVEYPLTTSTELDAGINTLNIFKSNAVESVINIKNIFYYKFKTGMKIWGNKTLKKERDNIFVRKGGITVLNKNKFLKEKKIISAKKLAHLLIHPLSSLNFQELNDYHEIISKK